ncbi:unnamed protein product [Chrysodeixis includens]|uniref:Uncharacterized protein n=1 Tax=Chrysodeixis includens TaxID=689277 RepID=A0A9P0FRD0_CHRIL|nr:unnamed protein product [Chrysodeixis includens]
MPSQHRESPLQLLRKSHHKPKTMTPETSGFTLNSSNSDLVLTPSEIKSGIILKKILRKNHHKPKIITPDTSDVTLYSSNSDLALTPNAIKSGLTLKKVYNVENLEINKRNSARKAKQGKSKTNDKHQKKKHAEKMQNRDKEKLKRIQEKALERQKLEKLQKLPKNMSKERDSRDNNSRDNKLKRNDSDKSSAGSKPFKESSRPLKETSDQEKTVENRLTHKIWHIMNRGYDQKLERLHGSDSQIKNHIITVIKDYNAKEIKTQNRPRQTQTPKDGVKSCNRTNVIKRRVRKQLWYLAKNAIKNNEHWSTFLAENNIVVDNINIDKFDLSLIDIDALGIENKLLKRTIVIKSFAHQQNPYVSFKVNKRHVDGQLSTGANFALPTQTKRKKVPETVYSLDRVEHYTKRAKSPIAETSDKVDNLRQNYSKVQKLIKEKCIKIKRRKHDLPANIPVQEKCEPKPIGILKMGTQNINNKRTGIHGKFVKKNNYYEMKSKISNNKPDLELRLSTKIWQLMSRDINFPNLDDEKHTGKINVTDEEMRKYIISVIEKYNKKDVKRYNPPMVTQTCKGSLNSTSYYDKHVDQIDKKKAIKSKILAATTFVVIEGGCNGYRPVPPKPRNGRRSKALNIGVKTDDDGRFLRNNKAYEFNENICKIIDDRMLCGYNKNVGVPRSRDTVIKQEGECRTKNGRVECGYEGRPLINPRRPPVWDNPPHGMETVIPSRERGLNDQRPQYTSSRPWVVTRCLEIDDRIVCNRT